MRNSLKVVIGGIAIFSCFVLRAQDKPGITVTSASYGFNVSRSAAGNATAYVKSACDGKRSCSIKVKDFISTIADPAIAASTCIQVWCSAATVAIASIGSSAVVA